MHVSGCLHMQVRCVCRIRHVNAAAAAWRRQNAETVAALSAHPDMGAVLRGTMAGAMLDWEGAPYPWWTVDGGHRDNCRQGKTPAGRSSTSAQAQEKGEAFLLTQANKAERCDTRSKPKPGEKCRHGDRGVAYQSEVGMLAERWMHAKQWSRAVDVGGRTAMAWVR